MARQYGYRQNLGKGVVVNTVVKGIRVDIIGSLYPGHTDGMGSYPYTASRCSACISSPVNS